LIAYQFGALTGTIIMFLLLSQLVHWILRKIRRRPRKSFRAWLTSWIAGPELFLFGSLGLKMYEGSPKDLFSFGLSAVLVWAGLIIFAVRLIASIVWFVRRRVARPSVSSPAISTPVASPAPPPVPEPPPVAPAVSTSAPQAEPGPRLAARNAWPRAHALRRQRDQ
jgi:hypothetical protein